MSEACPVLEALKRLALLLDDEAHGRIGRFEFYKKVDALKDEVDNAVIVNCRIKAGG